MSSKLAMVIGQLLCAAGGILSGCDRNPMAHVPGAGSAQTVSGTPLSQRDAGASLLAEVDNARMAIELHDRTAAYNDVVQALDFARQLANRPSALLLSEPIALEPRNQLGADKNAVSPRRMTAFDAMVKLGSAQVDLDTSLAAADADLRAIQTGIPTQLIPSDLELIRAAAGLDIARSAVSEGRIPELRTQLMAAQSALDAYAGPGHVTDAKALAEVIGNTLERDSALAGVSPDRISIWLGNVLGWTGSDRWKPAPK